MRALLTALLAAAALGAPSAAAAANVGFAVHFTGTGEGEVFCKVTEPGEEAIEEEFCDGPWPANTRIAFEAPLPEAGSEFSGYQGTGNAAGCAKACSFKLTEPSSVEVRFDLLLRTLRISYLGAGEGEVEVQCEFELEECEELEDGAYPKGAEITLTPAPEPGSEFLGFQAGAGSAKGCAGTAPCAFELQLDSSLAARFAIQRYTLAIAKQGAGTVTSAPAGISCGALCSARLEEGTEVLLSATPAPGFAFAGFSGPCTGTAPCQIAIEEDTVVGAEFRPLPPSATAATADPSPPPPPRACKVPRLAGKSLRAARSALRAAGCSVGRVARPRHKGGGRLVVRSSSPGAGARVTAGTRVGLRLGAGGRR